MRGRRSGWTKLASKSKPSQTPFPSAPSTPIKISPLTTTGINPAGVEYTLTVPRIARLNEIKLENGSLDIHGLAGEVHASCINGHLLANDLTGAVKISAVNGPVETKLAKLSGQRVELSSVNGQLELTLPSDANAEVEASNVMGSLE